MLTLGLNLGEVTHARNNGGGGFDGLDLDFAAGRYALNSSYSSSFPAGWSFSRTGAGTALTSAGAVVPFASGVPRITDRGLLVEEARTNLCPHSNDLTNAVWAKAASTATLVAGAPDGGNASRLTATGPFANAAQAAFAVTAGQAYTFSVYARDVTLPSVSLVFEGGDHGGNFVTFTYVFSTAAVSGDAGGFTSVVRSASPLQNGWVRLQLSFTVPAGVTTLRPRLWLGPYGPADQTGLAADFGNLQLEPGSFATSPIITTGAAATRGVDVASIIVPAGVSTYTATYGSGLTNTGGVTPGASFSLVTGRPWLNGPLRRLVMQ